LKQFGKNFNTEDTEKNEDTETLLQTGANSFRQRLILLAS
jgi:hypothetical protein